MLVPKHPDQLQLSLEIHVVRHLQVFDEAGRFDVVAMIEDELFLLLNPSS